MADTDIYPRTLSEDEKKIIFSILPDLKPGYREMKNRIESYYITGIKENDPFIFIMGTKDSSPDLVSASTPVFAIGTLTFTNSTIDVLIHELINDEIEIEISGDSTSAGKSKLVKNLNYSEWVPGKKSPEKNGKVLEIKINPSPYLLAFSPDDRKIWIYNNETGVNTLIPISNYYNHLMLLRNERKPSTVLNPNLFFNNLESYNNEELVSAFILYNKYLKRVPL